MEFCRVEREGHLLVVTLDRPQVRNALHRAASDELDRVWTQYETDPELRVAILTGTGDRSFSAGYDMREPSAATAEQQGPAFLAHRHPRGLGALTLRYDMSKPLIAAVNGVALGGGLELALACDVIIAAEHARLGLPEPRVGLMAAAGGVHRLPRHVPLKVAMGMILTGRPVSAAEAARIGLVNEVVPAGDLLATAERWAREMSECSPLAVQASKQAALQGLGRPVAEAMVAHYPLVQKLFTSEDVVEGPRAFAEKRKPVWRGR